jgi:hypothetical protein
VPLLLLAKGEGAVAPAGATIVVVPRVVRGPTFVVAPRVVRVVPVPVVARVVPAAPVALAVLVVLVAKVHKRAALVVLVVLAARVHKRVVPAALAVLAAVAAHAAPVAAAVVVAADVRRGSRIVAVRVAVLRPGPGAKVLGTNPPLAKRALQPRRRLPQPSLRTRARPRLAATTAKTAKTRADLFHGSRVTARGHFRGSPANRPPFVHPALSPRRRVFLCPAVSTASA